MDRPEPRPVRDLDDLHEWWRFVVGPWGFERRQLFAVLVAPDGTVVPSLMNVVDLPRRPDDESLDGLAEVLTGLAEKVGVLDGSVAALWARPGVRGPGADDVVWLSALHRVLTRLPLTAWPVFYANDDGPRPAVPDELVA